MIEGNFNARALTLSRALDIHPHEVADLPRYHIGSETSWVDRRRDRAPSSPFRSATETDELLGSYVDDAKAGAADAAIGRKAGLSSHQVKRWRIRRGVQREPGRPTTWKRTSTMAIEMFGRSAPPTMMPIVSVVGGEWSPPEYLLRYPLRYEKFAELMVTLVEAGHEPSMIAAGLGLREHDVADAGRLWAARARS